MARRGLYKIEHCQSFPQPGLGALEEFHRGSLDGGQVPPVSGAYFNYCCRATDRRQISDRWSILYRLSSIQWSAPQRLVRHRHLPERTIMTGIGPVAVRCPRVRDRVGEGGERDPLFIGDFASLRTPIEEPRGPDSDPLPQGHLHRRLRRGARRVAGQRCARSHGPALAARPSRRGNRMKRWIVIASELPQARR
jgi:hypothetical protein